MPDFNGSLTVAAPPSAVFDFVSKVGNLPQYLPTVKQAESAGPDRIRVTSVIEDESRTQDGFFRVATPGRRLEWGSDGDKDYHGSMDLAEAGQGQTNVTVQLHLNPPPQKAGEIEQRSGESFESQMQEGVERCLQSIKNIVEGKGGKSEIPESR